MTRNAAKKFWKEYLKLSCAKGRDSTTLNPAHTFLAQARIGAFDSISDAEYASRLKDAEELCLFWDFRDTETAKNVLLNAMSSTDISDKDISNIAGILASASVRSNYSIENSDKDKATKSIHTIDRRHMNMDITPGQLVGQLQQTVIGQDGYIKNICTAVWMHNLRYSHFIRTGEAISRPKHNVLCLGPSGTGKTLAIQALGKILDIPVLIEDASSLRGTGWRGNSVSSMIPRILEIADNDENKAKFTIVCLDEFDKIFQCEISDNSFYPTSNLLTFMGGAVITHTGSSNTTTSLDTSNLLFICLGAFDGLSEIIKKRLSGRSGIGFSSEGYQEVPDKNIFKSVTKDDLNQYGIPWEMLGRLSMITTTNDLSVDDFKTILTGSSISPIKQHDDLLHRSIGVHVSISDAATSYIAQTAHDTRMGVREMNRIVSEALIPAVYAIGNDSSITGISLDIGANGLFVSNQKGQRSIPSPNKPPIRRQDDRANILSEIDADILRSVPFTCVADKDNIVDYSMDIQDASENVKWRPISQIHPKPLLASAMCILAASICTQLLDGKDLSPTMYDLFKTTDKISPAMVAHDTSDQPLSLIRKEFMDKAFENSSNLSKATQIAKHMIRQYAHKYSYDAKYCKK